MIEFEESGMRFSFEESKSFHIEKSTVYQRLSCQNVSSVECVTMSGTGEKQCVLLIEAKSSTPNPNNCDGTGRLQCFLEGIYNKNAHSLQLCFACLHDVQVSESEIGPDLAKALCARPKIRCLLIVKDYRVEWCCQLQDALREKMRPWLRIWRAEVYVLTDNQARQKRLVL